MPRIEGTTNAQTKFLRSFRTDPRGPTAEKWPSPAILRRWLRRPGFVQAMRSIRDAMRYQADFQLLSAAASAAQGLHEAVATGEGDAARMKAMSDLMKLAHVRQRFANDDTQPPVRESTLIELLCTAHPNAQLHNVLDLYKMYTGRDLREEFLDRVRERHEAGIKRQPLAARPIRCPDTCDGNCIHDDEEDDDDTGSREMLGDDDAPQ